MTVELKPRRESVEFVVFDSKNDGALITLDSSKEDMFVDGLQCRVRKHFTVEVKKQIIPNYKPNKARNETCCCVTKMQAARGQC